MPETAFMHFARELHGECFLIAMNVNRQSVNCEISTAVLPKGHGTFHDVSTGLSAHVSNGHLQLSLPARTGGIFTQL